MILHIRSGLFPEQKRMPDHKFHCSYTSSSCCGDPIHWSPSLSCLTREYHHQGCSLPCLISEATPFPGSHLHRLSLTYGRKQAIGRRNIACGLAHVLHVVDKTLHRDVYTSGRRGNCHILCLPPFQSVSLVPQHLLHVRVLVLPFHGDPIQFGTCPEMSRSQYLIIHVQDGLHLL